MKMHSNHSDALTVVDVIQSKAQSDLFEAIAAKVGATQGEVILALACDRLRFDPLQDASAALTEVLWAHSAKYKLPELDLEWAPLVR